MPNKILTLIYLGLFCGGLSTHTSAQDEFSDEGYFSDLPVVLSAARLEQPLLESPSSISVIDAEMIRAIGARDIPELFRLLPGFQVGYFRGNRPVVTYHGLADQFARRMQVLIDGRSIYVASYGGVPWESLPLALDDIVRIEVIRGPNAASYGSNSFAGVINISTRHSTEDDGIYVQAKVGDRDMRSGGVSFSPGPADLDYRVTLETTEDAGFEDVVDDMETTEINGRIDYTINATDTLMLQLGANRGIQELGEEGGIGDPARNQDSEYYFHHLRWERSFSVDQALVVQYFYNQYDVKDSFEMDGTIPFDVGGGLVLDLPFFFAVDFDTQSKRHDLEVQYNFKPHESLRMVIGGSTRLDQVESLGYFNTDKEIDNKVSRLFTHAEWQLSTQLSLNAGAMVEDNEITGTDTSPKVSLLYKISPQQTVRTGLSYATRIPVLFEEEGEAVTAVTIDAPPPFDDFILYDYLTFGDGGLDPETIQSFEIGYRWLDQNTAFDIRIFQDQIDDLIVQNVLEPYVEDTVDQETFEFANQVSVDLVGVEAQLEVNPSAKLRLISSLAHIDTESKNDTPTEDFERSVPEWTASLLAIYRVEPSTLISFDYAYVNEVNWGDKRAENAKELRKLDFQFLKTLRLSEYNGGFSINLENLLGEYQDYDKDNVVDQGGYLKFWLRF